MVVSPLEDSITGAGNVFIVTFIESLQPFASVPIALYVVELVGLATGFEMFAALNPVEGDHKYDTAPLAVSVIVSPAQIAEGVA